MQQSHTPVSDRQFALELRDVLRAYLRAVDAWEAGYRKYYRMPGRNGIVSGDLREEWQSYLETRRSLQAMAPRARGLCFKYGLRDPWMPLLKANLGENAPQQRDSSAIGRGERNAVNECTVELLAAAEEWELPATAESPLARGPASWLRRIVDYLY
ncbi:MAG: hypothetical protein ABSH56_30230 [Bryobacteraceae bacterium]